MEFNAFHLIEEGLAQELEKQGFSAPQPLEDPAGQAVIFATDEVAYSLLYDRQHQRFQLRSTTLTADKKPGDWRSLSLWMFDEKEGTRADAESILNDFLEVVQGPKRVALVQQQKKQRNKGDERNVDPLFFLNRLVNIFPELKGELNEEKIVYGQVRFVTFVKEKVVPKCQDLAVSYPDSEPVKKLCGLLDDMYKDGDLDTRSIVTVGLLNSVSDSAFGVFSQRVGEELQKNLKYTRRLKGKKIKPEKKKKKKKVVAKPLDNKH